MSTASSVYSPVEVARGSEKALVRPPVGSHPSFTENNSWNRIPSQKIGAA